MSLFELSATEIARLVQSGEVTASKILEAHIARIAAHDRYLNCFTDMTFSRARAEAKSIDAKIAAGAPGGPLAGVPIAVKNLFDVQGLATRVGSKIFRDAPPAGQDAPLLQSLVAAGGILLGALNMDEFAYGFVTENAHDGATRNPHDPDRIAGGSSGGSAAAIAAGFAAITLGSDTNGSIRLPAGLTGTFGLKPTYGVLNRAGTFPFVDSFDHLGPFARHAADLALAFDIMRGVPPGKIGPPPDRIAVLDDWFEQAAAPEMLAAVAAVADGLGGAAKATLPAAKIARAAAFCITAFEGGQLHKRNLIARPQDYDPATSRGMVAGTLQPAETIYAAQKFRAWFRDQAAKLFQTFDLLLAPATPCTAPLIGQKTMMLDGVEMPVRPNLGLYTQPISFIGLPVVCVPVTAPGRLPRGVQIIAAPGREDQALAAAAHLERHGICRAPVAVLA
jgi:AtzE family amidohydrolase